MRKMLLRWGGNEPSRQPLGKWGEIWFSSTGSTLIPSFIIKADDFRKHVDSGVFVFRKALPPRKHTFSEHRNKTFSTTYTPTFGSELLMKILPSLLIRR
ncbi:hypothetical protein CDAR_456481 [Caerostris darwini]|uniref:Uncharacterized protein n=1 Tax=Caerostris darwini TaxID=1538125 RepID=A0AAV4NYX8_9ARAC|nr:hypothetical protein CDAR_456481 [Caerostris darwini]